MALDLYAPVSEALMARTAVAEAPCGEVEEITRTVFEGVRQVLEAHRFLFKIPAKHYVKKVNSRVESDTNFGPGDAQMAAVLHEVFLRLRIIFAKGETRADKNLSGLVAFFPGSEQDINDTASVIIDRLETLFGKLNLVETKVKELMAEYEQTLMRHEIKPEEPNAAHVLHRIWLKLSDCLGANA